jgi:hypothetical protein
VYALSKHLGCKQRTDLAKALQPAQEWDLQNTCIQLLLDQLKEHEKYRSIIYSLRGRLAQFQGESASNLLQESLAVGLWPRGQSEKNGILRNLGKEVALDPFCDRNL